MAQIKFLEGERPTRVPYSFPSIRLFGTGSRCFWSNQGQKGGHLSQLGNNGENTRADVRLINGGGNNKYRCFYCTMVSGNFQIHSAVSVRYKS